MALKQTCNKKEMVVIIAVDVSVRLGAKTSCPPLGAAVKVF